MHFLYWVFMSAAYRSLDFVLIGCAVIRTKFIFKANMYESIT